jgi:hypothetical protein
VTVAREDLFEFLNNIYCTTPVRHGALPFAPCEYMEFTPSMKHRRGRLVSPPPLSSPPSPPLRVDTRDQGRSPLLFGGVVIRCGRESGVRDITSRLGIKRSLSNKNTITRFRVVTRAFLRDANRLSQIGGFRPDLVHSRLVFVYLLL